MTIAIATVSKMSDEDRRRVEAVADVTWLDFSSDRDGLAERGGEVEVVYGNVREHELAALPHLRWVHATWSGIENLLYPAMVGSEVIITNTRGQVALQMSEHAVAGLLHLCRDFPTWVAASRDRQWRADSHATLLSGSTVAVLGTGAIAKVLIPKLTALGATVWGVNSDGRPFAGCEACFTLETIRERLGEIDHIVILLASTPATRKVIDGEFLGGLKPGAGVVNLSRGTVLDEAALIEQIDAGHLRGAVLDVTDPEPPAEDSPLFGHPRILLTGHRSWQPPMGNRLAMEVFIANLKAFAEGRTEAMVNVVDKSRGY